MARLTHIIRDIIIIAFQNHRASATLCDLRTAFARTLIPDLDQPENTAQFADMYAQTIAYGLFAARCNHGMSGPFRRLGAAAEIPKTNPFLRKLFTTITGPDLDDEPYCGFVDDLAALLNNANIEEVLAEFGARTRREDPVVHFYETFLATYDPKVRERRGVYYTPEPVVSYIVRSVDHILRTRFGLPDGLADTATVCLRNAAVPAAGASEDAGDTRSAAVPAAPASGDAGGGAAFRVRDRGYLPHWEAEGSIYFITFRLGDSLPESVLSELRAEREAGEAALQAEGHEITEADRRRLAYLFSQRVDGYLDAGTGACYLGRPEVGKLMAEALRHFDGERYRLFAWCVMPNHVHVVCDFLGGHGLKDVLHSWKSYVAHRANRMLGRKGRFWAREYYDHIVRDEDDFYRIVRYVASNSDAAGLRDWPWVWACEDYRDVVPERSAAVSAAGASGDAGVTRSAAVSAAPASGDAGVTVPRVLILDAACGTGLSSIPLARAGYRVVGVDRSERMLQVARSKAGNALPVRFVWGDLLSLDLPWTFDAAVCMHSGLDYILDTEDLERALAALRRCLRPGGLLAFDKCLDEPAFYRRDYSDSMALSCGRAEFEYRWDRTRRLLEQRCIVTRNGSSGLARTEVVFHLRAVPLRELVAMTLRAGFTLLEAPRQFTVSDPGMGIFRAI